MPTIRPMTAADAAQVTQMMRTFYASPAVLTNGSDDIFAADIAACTGDSPYAEGYIFEQDGHILGYAMLAKSFSTEFGKRCIWIEDLYIKDEYRGRGLGTQFFDFLHKRYTDVVFRLEVEKENERAVHVYGKAGYDILPYTEMIKR